MSKNFIHEELATGRWQKMSLAEQLGNVGSEVGRALKAKEQGNVSRMESAFDRALELLDLTIVGAKTPSEIKELCRVRGSVADYFYGTNEFQSTAASLDKYFYHFAVAARR